MANERKGRPYRKRKRAEQEEETRRRITEAVVELHRTVGPAATKVTEVAERAGVSRMTVYNHFPTEVDLVEACSAHWAAQNPPPPPHTWADTADPVARLSHALHTLYPWYADRRDMMGNVLRDAPLVEGLSAVMESRWGTYITAVADSLEQGWPDEGTPARRSALLLAVDFTTWRTLRNTGLGDRAAADLMARMVAGG